MSTSALLGIFIPFCIRRDLLKHVGDLYIAWLDDVGIYAVDMLGSHDNKF